MAKNRKIPIIDLFAGVGGLGLGAGMVGGEVRLSIDFDSYCCESLRLNQYSRSHVILQADVTSIDGLQLRKHAHLNISDPLIIVGGPPCQPFSKAAYWTDPGDIYRHRRARAKGEAVNDPPPSPPVRTDERRNLVCEFVRLVCESRADGFVFENVPSILHPRNKVMVDWIISTFEQSGYLTTLVEENAASFGVAQLRRRVFILGHRREKPSPPTPSHSDKTDVSFEMKPYVTTGEVLSEFNTPEYFEPEEVVQGRWAEHLREIPPGWNYKWHTAWAGHPKPTFETETRFWSFLLKLAPDKPSWTIAASPGPWVGPFHWDSRRLRTVELAAIQGFPRGFVFSGPRREKVRQIGNAVPPPLAAAMIQKVLTIERRARDR